ncbi:MAG TPA: alpha/beta fold hydrolase, partial [Gemmatimonadaceae bacterium]|nr:alpha/beta fold hydrolase [Gemmatimonadaceae bacterium]
MLLAAALGTWLSSPGRAGAQPSSECRIDSVPGPLRCHTVPVRERMGDSASRLIGLRVVVLPARGSASAKPPLVLLQGGPGVAGIPMARRFAASGLLREGRDVIVLDQRGTGESNRLSCEALGRKFFFGALLPKDHVSACRQRLAAHADLRQYHSTASAHDIEAIRRALGYERLDVWGFSFGSRVAMAYAREYPGRVRALILDGVVPFDAGLVADHAQSLQRSIDDVVARCARDARCRAAFPDPAGTLRRVVARLDRAPAIVRLTDPAGATRAFSVGRWELAYAVRGMLYGARAAALPAMLHRADSSGDLSAFARLYAERSAWPGDATGLAPHLGAYCAEDLPFVDTAAVARRTRGTLIGSLYHEQYRAGCDAWPMPRVPARSRTPLRSDVPALLISGERDPVTPPAYGERVARSLPRARHVVVPGGGHAEQSPCKTSVVAAFL